MTGETDTAREKQQADQKPADENPSGPVSPPSSLRSDETPESAPAEDTTTLDVDNAAASAPAEDAASDDSSPSPVSSDDDRQVPGRGARRIKIGSQRDDSPSVTTPQSASGISTMAESNAATSPPMPTAEEDPATATSDADSGDKADNTTQQPATAATSPGSAVAEDEHDASTEIDSSNDRSDTVSPAHSPKPTGYPPPRIRGKLSPDLEEELEAAMAGASMDELMAGTADAPAAEQLEPHSTHVGRVVSIHHEDVFIDLGGRNQGIVALRQFKEPPEPGIEIETVVSRFDAEDGLYELSLPGGVVSIGDWSQLAEGMVIETQITGHNKGGLECQVKNIRGFMPASQISLYHVDDFDEFVGQKLACVVTEANQKKRNLVLSHRAVLEREQAAARDKLLAELEPGQTREGVVRNIRDFGAFVDLGGVDGLLHISQLSWSHVKHPSEVLQQGQTVKVNVRKIEPDTGKISLSLKDLQPNPWDRAALDYPAKSNITGRVSKITNFGAFVELETGVEGLIHISELAPNRVARVTDVVSVDQEVEVMVLSVDTNARRISLSLKALAKQAEASPSEAEDASEEESEPEAVRRKYKKPLKGGLGRSSGGEEIGLNW